MKRLLVCLLIISFLLGLSFVFGTFSFAQRKYNEAPMLAELVKQGKLPPIEERLPKEPFVVGPGVLIPKNDLPNWEVGKYGGTLRTAHAQADFAPFIFMMNNVEPLLMAPGIGLRGIRGNVLRDFKVSPDNKVFTFYMREGLKWSDGTPVTTEDVLFTYEDVLMNEKLTPIFPATFRSAGKADGEPMKLEILDKYSFRISFKESYGGFLREITIKNWCSYTMLIKPKHYLKQFHVKYTPIEKLKPLLEKEGFKDEWWQLFHLKDFTNWEQCQPKSAGFPVLNAWVISPESTSTRIVWERNPYYFKVDIAGNQLPYIDRITSDLVSDTEMENMRMITGQIDLLSGYSSLDKLPLYKQNAGRGGYRVILLDYHVDPSAIYLNLTYKDPTWRRVVRDVRFRRAINMAINRKEIINSIYYGFASLPKTVPSEYNPTKAEQILDEIGLKRGPDGWRLGPDGKVFEILIESGAHAPDLMPAAELVTEHLKSIGLKVSLKRIDPSLWSQRLAANEAQACVIWSVQPMWKDGTWADYLPTSQWGREWSVWYSTNGKEGEEPPVDIKRIYKIHEGRLAAIPYSTQDVRLTNELYKLYYENVYYFPLAERVKYAFLISNRIGNVPRSGQAIAANMAGEQYFFKR